MSKRIELIDGLRGLSVVLLVLHHALYDAAAFLGAPWWIFTNPVLDALHYIFAGVFIGLCGVSSRFSRSNVKRGLKTAVAALAVTGATVFVGEPVLFGILHLLACCMLLYGVLGRALEKLPPKLAPVLYVLLTVFSALAVRWIKLPGFLWPLGWVNDTFYSADYFPLFPWLFVFLLGTWAGEYIRDGRLPKWFYEKTVPFFPAVGRKSLLIYLLHQPVLYGLTLLILYII